MNEKLVVAVDFGNSKIAVAVALKKEENQLQMVDFIKIDSNENLISNGKIVDNAALANEVITLIRQIESNNNLKIDKIHFAAAPHTLRSEIRKISVERSNLNSQSEDNERLTDAAEDVEISDTRCVFDVARLETTFGSKAEGNFLLISSQNAVKEQFVNFKNSSLSAYKPKCFVAPLVEAEQFLSSEQKKNGALLVDFGAGCTSFAVYQNDFPRLCAVIPLGSKHITKDIHKHFNILEVTAEKLKSESIYGLALRDNLKLKGTDISIDQNVLKAVIHARLDEIFKFVFDELKSQKQENINEIVLVGGGADMIFLPEYLKKISGKEVKIANFSVDTNSRTKDFICNENALLFALLKNCNEDCSKFEEKPVLPNLTEDELKQLEIARKKREDDEKKELLKKQRELDKIQKKNRGIRNMFQDWFGEETPIEN